MNTKFLPKTFLRLVIKLFGRLWKILFARQRLRENQTVVGQYLKNLPNNIFLGSA